MLELLLKGARIAGATDTREIGVRDGLIAQPEAEARQVIDLGGSLVTPALLEPHLPRASAPSPHSRRPANTETQPRNSRCPRPPTKVCARTSTAIRRTTTTPDSSR